VQVLGKALSCSMTTFVRLPSAALLRAALLSIFPQEASTLDPLLFGLVLEDLIESAVVPLRTQVSASLLAHVHGTRLFPCVHVCVCASAAVVIGRTQVSASLLLTCTVTVCVFVCMYVCACMCVGGCGCGSGLYSIQLH